MKVIDKAYTLPVIGSILRHRFFKFGTVGFSGTIVNVAMLYLNQEFLFRDIHPPGTRLYVSLAGAIFVATINNFLWNRIWTWGDRKEGARFTFFVQMGQYFLACSCAIFLQYVFTIVFSRFIHYVMANMASIILAAIFVYILNDIWTFSVKKID